MRSHHVADANRVARDENVAFDLIGMKSSHTQRKFSESVQMRKFDGEQERSVEVQKSLHEQFSFFERVYNFAASIDMTSRFWGQNIDESITTATSVLVAQAFRLCRSIFEECSRAEGFCARLPLRSLYETAMATAFILEPTVRIRAEKSVGENRRQKVDRNGRPMYYAKPVNESEATPGDLLSQKFRAQLYIAHRFFMAEKLAEKCERIPLLAQFKEQMRSNVDTQGVAHFDVVLGPEWSYICRGRSYSGLHVWQLAEILGPTLVMWYETIYMMDSSISHGTAGLMHVSSDWKRLVVLSDDREVFVTLQGAAMLFIAMLRELHDNIGLGEENGRALDRLRSECSTTFKPDRLQAQLRNTLKEN